MRRRVDALLVNTRQRGPGQMLGFGDADVKTSLIDAVTGGTYQELLDSIDTVSLLLKIVLAASLVAGVAGVAVLASGKGR